MKTTKVEIGGKSYTPAELEQLGKLVGSLATQMDISDEQLSIAVAVMPLLCGFARGHGESSLVVVSHTELERFNGYVEARKARK